MYAFTLLSVSELIRTGGPAEQGSLPPMTIDLFSPRSKIKPAPEAGLRALQSSGRTVAKAAARGGKSAKLRGGSVGLRALDSEQNGALEQQ